MAEIKINNKVAQKENGILARMWKNVVSDLNLHPALDHLVSRYVNKSKVLGSLSNVKDVKRKTKNTLIKNIEASEMTWKTFHDLLFNYLGAKRIDISIKITMPNGSESVHSMSVLGEDYAENTNKGNVDERSRK